MLIKMNSESNIFQMVDLLFNLHFYLYCKPLKKLKFILFLFFVLFHLIFADRLEERASSDKNVDPLSAPHNHPPEDPFGSVPFISHSGKLHM